MRVRVAVVGCGMIAELNYIPSILGNPRAELVAICTRSTERADDRLVSLIRVPAIVDFFGSPDSTNA